MGVFHFWFPSKELRDSSAAFGQDHSLHDNALQMNESTKAVFLSYASQDAGAASRICQTLREAGIEVTVIGKRWKLDPLGSPRFSGDRDQLVEFLRDHYEFTIRRAEAEVDEFYFTFENRIRQASAPSLGQSKPAA